MERWFPSPLLYPAALTFGKESIKNVRGKEGRLGGLVSQGAIRLGRAGSPVHLPLHALQEAFLAAPKLPLKEFLWQLYPAFLSTSP